MHYAKFLGLRDLILLWVIWSYLTTCKRRENCFLRSSNVLEAVMFSDSKSATSLESSSRAFCVSDLAGWAPINLLTASHSSLCCRSILLSSNWAFNSSMSPWAYIELKQFTIKNNWKERKTGIKFRAKTISLSRKSEKNRKH